MRGRKAPPRRPSVLCERHHPPRPEEAVRASCRLTHLRCWVAPGRDSSSSAGSVRRVPSLRSSVSLRLEFMSGSLFVWRFSNLRSRLRVSGESSEPTGLRRLNASNPPPPAPLLKHQPAARLSRSEVVTYCFYSRVSASSRGTVLPRFSLLPSLTCRGLRPCLLDFYVRLPPRLTPSRQPPKKVRAQSG